MNYRSINVVIEPPHIFPWRKQKIQVDGNDMFEIRRDFRFFSILTEVRDYRSHDVVLRISRPKSYRSEYKIETTKAIYSLRKISYWQWECRSNKDELYINRLGSVKCVLSQQGRQMAIMSLNTNLPFVDDRNTYIRVNNEKYMCLSIATALILKSWGFNLSSLRTSVK